MTLRPPRVLPPWDVVAMVFILHAATVGGILVYCAFVGPSGGNADEIFASVPPIALVLGAIAYGFYRVGAFHPLVRDGYYEWLQQTPWTHPKPLPLGPVHLAWQDVVLVGVAALSAYPEYGGTRSLGVAQAFLFTYLFSLAICLFRTCETACAYAVWFGLGWMALFHDGGLPFWAAAVLTYTAGFAGIRRSFRDLLASVFIARNLLPSLSNNSSFGWPFGRLTPRDRSLRIPRVDAVIFALLGWWATFVFERLTAEITKDEPWGLLFPMLSILVVPWVILARIRAFRVWQYLPPISLAGRAATGRWIIPAYDRVFVAPILAALAWYLAPFVLYRAGLDWSVAVPAGFALALLSVLAVGPDRRHWWLTAESRLVPNPFGWRNPNQWV
jgi:hypothetical protein